MSLKPEIKDARGGRLWNAKLDDGLPVGQGVVARSDWGWDLTGVGILDFLLLRVGMVTVGFGFGFGLEVWGWNLLGDVRVCRLPFWLFSCSLRMTIGGGFAFGFSFFTLLLRGYSGVGFGSGLAFGADADTGAGPTFFKRSLARSRASRFLASDTVSSVK